jgi:type I restriction enzyme M protein
MAKRHHSDSSDLQSVFLRLEELVLANSGEDEFEEVFKLLIAKIFDEKFNAKPEFYSSSNAEDVRSRVTLLLRRAEDRWPGILEPFAETRLTPDHLAVCVNELSKHRVSGGTLESLDAFFEFLVSRSSKGNKGQYFTPRHVVEMCVRIINPTEKDTVADPACGSGGFLVHALQHIGKGLGYDRRALATFANSGLWGFDIDERAVRIARALLVVVADVSGNLFNLNSLVPPERSKRLLSDPKPGNSSLCIEDTFRSKLRGHAPFDVILTNPPFAGEIRERDLLDAYDSSKGKVRCERDVLFLERCLNLLKPNGRMAIVLPHNKLSASGFRELRAWVAKRATIVGIVSLGRNVFMPHTQQKTGVLFLQKKRDVWATQNLPIFLSISQRDGKDSRGSLLKRAGVDEKTPMWERLDHDLDEIVEKFPMENFRT